MKSGKQTRGGKRALVIIIIFAALLLISIPFLWMKLRRPVITHRIRAHAQELTALAEKALAERGSGEWEETTYKPRWAKKGVIYKEYNDRIIYEVSAFGIVPSSITYGYYYAPDGVCRAMPGMEDYDSAESCTGFLWEEPEGDNGCYIEHMGGKLYYYEEWY